MYTMDDDPYAWFGPIPSTAQVVGSVMEGEKMIRFGVRTNRRAWWILTECPKRVGSFRSSTRFQMRKVVGK